MLHTLSLYVLLVIVYVYTAGTSHMYLCTDQPAGYSSLIALLVEVVGLVPSRPRRLMLALYLALTCFFRK